VERGVYVNDLGEAGDERVRAAYGQNYERLVAVKNTYDPTYFFRLNHDIQPTIWLQCSPMQDPLDRLACRGSSTCVRRRSIIASLGLNSQRRQPC
jgi:Berberine and berberine like